MVSFNCPNCNASDIVMRGKRHNKSGTKQLYRCNECRSTFVEPDGFERMRHKKEEIEIWHSNQSEERWIKT